MTGNVIGLDGAPRAISETSVADVERVCENAKALREVVIVGRDNDGQVQVYGSQPSPADALWMLEAGKLWFLTGGQITIAQPAAADGDDEPAGR